MAFPFFLKKLVARTGLAKRVPSVRRELGEGAAYLRYCSDRVLASPYSELLKLSPIHESHGPDTIDLAQGEPRFDLVPSGSTKLPADRRGLPPHWGLPELCEAVTERLRTANSLAVAGDDAVLITQGVTGAFQLCLDAFVNPGDAVALFDPASPLYSLVLRQRRARLRWVPTWTEQGRIRFHLEPLVKSLKGARLLVVNAPANPTGGVFAAEDLEQIAWWAARCDSLIFDDRVFDEYWYDGDPKSVQTFRKARNRTLTAGSVSKTYALASARVGWLAGNRHLVQPCLLTSVLQGMSVPTLCQQMALAALQLPEDQLRPIHDEFESRRGYAYTRLQGMGLQPIWPAGGLSLWLPVHELGLTGRAFAERLLRDKKVVVWPGDDFGPSGAGFVRISYASDDGRLRQGLSRLGELVRELQGNRVERLKKAA